MLGSCACRAMLTSYRSSLGVFLHESEIHSPQDGSNEDLRLTGFSAPVISKV